MVKFSRTEIFDFLADAKVLEEWDANEGFVDHCRQAVEDAVGRVLTDRMRQVYVMYYLDGISTTQIAEMLGLDCSSVCRTLKRARKRVEKVLFYPSPNILHSQAVRRNRRTDNVQ